MAAVLTSRSCGVAAWTNCGEAETTVTRTQSEFGLSPGLSWTQAGAFSLGRHGLLCLTMDPLHATIEEFAVSLPSMSYDEVKAD